MAGAKSALVLFPRFTTLIGTGEFTAAPLDVSMFGSAQFELFRGPLIDAGGGQFRLYMEDSLDGVSWFPDAATAQGYDPGSEKSLVLSRPFSMKWFRLRAKLSATDAGARIAVTCWAEGVLRA